MSHDKCNTVNNWYWCKIAGSSECRSCCDKRRSPGSPAMTQHFTFSRRELPRRLLRKNQQKAEIARIMNRDRSTIYREIKQNSGQKPLRRSVTLGNAKRL